MTLDDLARLVAAPPIDCWPELRWWLAEGLHTDQTLRYEIDAAHRLGFGGMEFLAMDEAGVDHSRYGWGSEEWVHDSQIVMEETTRRGMSVSFTSGTNWSNANLPTITPEHLAAAKELDFVFEDLQAGRARTGALPRVDLNLEQPPALLPGLDRSTSPTGESVPAVTETVQEITEWSISVESWDAGELQTMTEDRGLGYQTREARPTTAITRIDTGTGPLKPWKDIQAVGPDVSGIGDYTATLTFPNEPAGDARYLLDLGSTAGGLGSVRVNDGLPRGFDTSRPRIDITADLRPGDNSLLVRVASSLNNRLLARGYYEDVLDLIGSIILDGPPRTQQTQPHPHGLLGPVRLIRETRAG